MLIAGPFKVDCDFDVENGQVLTVIHHDAEERERAPTSPDVTGATYRKITYYGMDENQLKVWFTKSTKATF